MVMMVRCDWCWKELFADEMEEAKWTRDEKEDVDFCSLSCYEAWMRDTRTGYAS